MYFTSYRYYFVVFLVSLDFFLQKKKQETTENYLSNFTFHLRMDFFFKKKLLFSKYFFNLKLDKRKMNF